jgi:hypothetical protein
MYDAAAICLPAGRGQRRNRTDYARSLPFAAANSTLADKYENSGDHEMDRHMTMGSTAIDWK